VSKFHFRTDFYVQDSGGTTATPHLWPEDHGRGRFQFDVTGTVRTGHQQCRRRTKLAGRQRGNWLAWQVAIGRRREEERWVWGWGFCKLPQRGLGRSPSWAIDLFGDLDWPLNASRGLSAILSSLIALQHAQRAKSAEYDCFTARPSVDSCIYWRTGGKKFFSPTCTSLPRWTGSPWNWVSALGIKNLELEVCALCGDADPRRVCRKITFRVTCSAWGSDMKYIYNGWTDSRIFRLKCSWCSSRHAT